MRRNAVRKKTTAKSAAKNRKPTLLKLIVSVDDAEARRRQIAREAEEAANLPGNAESVDFEAFAFQYGKTGTGDFA